MLDKFMGALSGKKTYITALLGALTAIGAYLAGDLSGADTLQAVWGAVMAATIRNGISATAK